MHHDSSNGRLLIVDDEAAQMKALCDTLRDDGYETVGFTEGNAALAALRESSFDLVLTDLMMPAMDGIALFRAAQKIDPHLVGIVMTGHGTIDSAVAAMKAGALDYILKPFDLSTILPVLSRALSVRRLRMENEALTRRLQDRTVQLEAAVDAAAQAQRAKSAFLANTSHELRTPLNGIIGFTEVLLDGMPGPLTPKQADYLNEVYQCATHLLQLINDVLDLSKAEACKMGLALESFPISKAIADICNVIAGLARKKQITLTWKVSPDVDAVVLDRKKFKQICYNLIGNAVKFSNPGGQVEVTATSHDGDRFKLRVKDNGIGIKAEDLPRLFQEFERLNLGAAGLEGTGLGLALTRKLVELHGGVIEVQSEYGHGSLFTAILPRQAAPTGIA